jgi:hypothetical protein
MANLTFASASPLADAPQFKSAQPVWPAGREREKNVTVGFRNRRVTVRLTELKLDWCEGALPTPEGRVELRWRQDGAKLRYQIRVPAGYAVAVENRSGRELVHE